MRDHLRRPARYGFRTSGSALLLISGLALAGCATNRPPQISYDAEVPPLPPVPAAVTEAPPRPLHTPPAWTPARGGAAAGSPTVRVENANAAARVEPRNVSTTLRQLVLEFRLGMAPFSWAG